MKSGDTWEMQLREIREGRGERSWGGDSGWNWGVEGIGQPNLQAPTPARAADHIGTALGRRARPLLLFRQLIGSRSEVRLQPEESEFHQDHSFRVHSSVTIRVTCPWHHFHLLEPKSFFFFSFIEVSARTVTFK